MRVERGADRSVRRSGRHDAAVLYARATRCRHAEHARRCAARLRIDTPVRRSAPFSIKDDIRRVSSSGQTDSVPALPPRLRVTLPWPVALAVFAAWALLAAYALAGLLVGLVRLEQLKSDALPLPVEYRDAMPQWNRANKGRRPVRLCVSDAVDVPVAVGLFDAMILIPKSNCSSGSRRPRWSRSACTNSRICAAPTTGATACSADRRRARLEPGGALRRAAARARTRGRMRRLGARFGRRRASVRALPDEDGRDRGVAAPRRCPRRASSPRANRSRCASNGCSAAAATSRRTSRSAPAAAAVAAVGALALAIAFVAPSIAAPAIAQTAATTARVAAKAAAPQAARAAEHEASYSTQRLAQTTTKSLAQTTQATAQAAQPSASPKTVVITKTVVERAPGLPIPPAPPHPAASDYGDTISRSVDRAIDGAAGAKSTAAIGAAAAAMGHGFAKSWGAEVGKIVAQEAGQYGVHSRRTESPALAATCTASTGRDAISAAPTTPASISPMRISQVPTSPTASSTAPISAARISADASFRGAHLTGCDFSDANLDGADFSNAWMSGCEFTGARLQTAQLRGVLNGCKGCDFSPRRSCRTRSARRAHQRRRFLRRRFAQR